MGCQNARRAGAGRPNRGAFSNWPFIIWKRAMREGAAQTSPTLALWPGSMRNAAASPRHSLLPVPRRVGRSTDALRGGSQLERDTANDARGVELLRYLGDHPDKVGTTSNWPPGTAKLAGSIERGPLTTRAGSDRTRFRLEPCPRRSRYRTLSPEPRLVEQALAVHPEREDLRTAYGRLCPRKSTRAKSSGIVSAPTVSLRCRHAPGTGCPLVSRRPDRRRR